MDGEAASIVSGTDNKAKGLVTTVLTGLGNFDNGFYLSIET